MIPIEKIEKIVKIYGKVIEPGLKVNSEQFADLLKKRFALNNPITHQIINLLRDNWNYNWENRYNKIRVTKIK